MKSEILLLKSKIKYLEFESRKNNIFLHGVEEKETNNLELINTVIELFKMPSSTEQAEEKEHNWDKCELSNEARESGKYATIRNGKLIKRNKTESEKRGRTPSTPLSAPPNNFSKAPGKPKLHQPAKISKTKPTEGSLRIKVNSNTEETSKY
ncbi:unnamed protein product [Leptidea sinapis]|uniref:Uncharacterized protein n=1 Tax=Leptidea sinapis TaxID=189913 RepID=A0A5E4Q021_9NEOP|nr:unnamed protein product [Leptidea sinapis]